MSTTNKIVSMTLTATTALWASGAFLLLPVASAQSTADLQAQIAALLAQIQQLQGKLTPSGPAMASHNFTQDLTVGSRGSDVTALQQLLWDKGFLKVSPTGYFGGLTRAAVVAWQKEVGLSPAVGYFGPKSRAFVNSIAVSPTPHPVVLPPAPVTPPTPGTPPPPPSAPASGVNVALSSDNPAAGALISSAGSAAARVPVLTVGFTAGAASAVTVSEIKFKKTGVISDSSIAGAYLVQNGKVIAQYNSISSGVISFAGLNWSVAAGQTMALTLAIDPATGLTAGNTVGFALNSAADITTVDASGAAVAEGGVFPMNGNTFTVTTVSNPAIASLTVASTSIATTVTAGTTNNIVGAFNFTATNSKVWLKGINFKVIGSANKGDMKNLKLYVNGTQVGSTLASVASDGTAYFDLSAAPGTLNTGSNNLQVYGDVMGSPSYDFQFEILNSYDVYAVDSQYNVPVSAASNVGTKVTIQTGTVTVAQASDTPTGNLAQGQSGVTIAKFTIYAAGEAVKVKFLDFTMTFSSSTVTSTAILQAQVKNVALTDDAGGQVGTTISTPPTSNTCGGSVAAGVVAALYTDCFGTSASPINYIVPANTTRVVSLKADIQSGATFGTVIGALKSMSSNLQGLTSSATGSSGSSQGAVLTLVTTQLTVTQNTALGTQNISKNSTNVKVGSYALTASSADGVTISTLTITAGASSTISFQNLKVLVGGTQFGVTQGLVTNSQAYSFSGTQFTVPKGGTTYVDVYADILSGAATMSPATQISGLSGTGVTSFNSVSLASTVNGQGITIAGQPTLTVALDSGTPAASQLVMGSTGNSLASFRFTETSNVENVKITSLNVFDQVAATSSKSGFGNVSLYQGSALVGTAGSAVTAASTSNPGPGFIYTFNFATPVVIPQANSITLTLKGDVSSYASSGASDNTTHTFKIATSTDSTNGTTTLTVVALGNSSNATSSVTLSSASANAMTLLRSKLTVTAIALGSTSNRAKSAVDDLATVSFAADAAGAVTINTVTVTFSGNAPSIATFMGGVNLYDSSNGTNLGTANTGNVFGTGTITLGPTAAATSTATSTFPITIGGLTVATTTAVASGTTATAIATIITAVINASTSIVGVTATSSGSVITLTQNTASNSSITVSAATPQGGNITFTTTNVTGGNGCIGSNTCTKTFVAVGYTVSAGTTKSFNLRIDDTLTLAGAANITQTLSAKVNANTDVSYTDGLDTSAQANINLPASVAPIQIQSVSFVPNT